MTLVAGTSACAGDDAADRADGGPGSSAAEGTDALEPEVTVDPGPAPVVDLIDAGEGERRVLAYAPSREPSVVAITSSAARLM